MRHLPGTNISSYNLGRDEGQVSIIVVLAVGLFLLLFVGFGVDMTAQQASAILVLDPTEPKSFQTSGDPTLFIVGGPNRSIQVNSAASAANSSGDAAYLSANNNKTQVDLSQAGMNYDGADFGVTGGPTTETEPSPFKTNAPFTWRSGMAPVADPFVNLPPPPDPNAPGTVTPVAFGVDGCPDSIRIPPGGLAPGCLRYTAGDYPGGITVTDVTAVFDPGVYYIKGGQLRFGSQSIVRPGTAAGDESMGTIFYLTCANPGNCTSATEASIYIDAQAGSCPTCLSIASFDTSRAHCPGDTPPGWDPRMGIPAFVEGNVLMAPCTTLGTYVGAVMSGIGTDTVGPARGILLFADRSAGVKEFISGGGGLLLTGTMYFRDCPTLLASGTCKNPPTDYQTQFTLDGGSGSNTRVLLGEIVTDQMILKGNSGITMDLNP